MGCTPDRHAERLRAASAAPALAAPTFDASLLKRPLKHKGAPPRSDDRIYAQIWSRDEALNLNEQITEIAA
ncbi:hypothetical protein MESS4_790116 [Mesorhizobium sp. STM 4661]|nr:hypothetical protein MESS4_790116 [Mesorhizobium sp. STM 4661]